MKTQINMPELLIFAKSLAIGFLAAEIWRIAIYLGTTSAATISWITVEVRIAGILLGALLCLTYAYQRDAHITAMQMGRSLRFDLLISIGVGIWINSLTSQRLIKVHEVFEHADPHWGLAIFLLLSSVLLSPIIRKYCAQNTPHPPQLYFISDEEIRNEKEDLLANGSLAKSFAETVLASGAHSGLVFGVDGPWGSGKTSFINLAECYWKKETDKAIVCRFEPLRYASEPDLVDRLIRDLSAAIQKEVFAPEFRPAVSRYSRLIKGKTDFSFLGFKLSVEPSPETIDELLDDIDDVLRRIGRRIIIVIDDLDRLDAKTINNVLFATRQTFKLTQATYILCYDTEILAGGKEEGTRAREFLEKFVTAKLSLFIDSSSIRAFLTRDWQRLENQLVSIPSDTMLKLGAILNELASILDGEKAANYLPLLGDLRKVKRFVNAMLLMQLDKSDLGRTDFNKTDLINLMLLHLNFPGLFRRIYAEETEGRSGTFSIRHENGEQDFKNADDFTKVVKAQTDIEQFLLTQLFDVTALKLGKRGNLREAVQATRACFNDTEFRNLEGYLKLIVRFATPEPRNTFVLYQDAFEKIQKGKSIRSILTSPDFDLGLGEQAHDQFWRILVNQSHNFTSGVAEDAIDTLVDYLPRYSMIKANDFSLRSRSIYSLLRLLDRVGWGTTVTHRVPNSPENVVEIVWRIFGENAYKNRGLLDRLTRSERGALGWYDLMAFRLQCSADRQGQLHNLHSALIVDQDKNAPTFGSLNELALLGMRRLSQEVFALFKRTYIDKRRNFLAEVDDAPSAMFLGETSQVDSETSKEKHPDAARSLSAQDILASRSNVKSFVLYQLSNPFPPTGAGVGCGYYDEYGSKDGKGIATIMNEYMFGCCFNPTVHEGNILHFLNYCLSHLSNSYILGGGYIATKEGLLGGLDPKEMGRYWIKYESQIREQIASMEDKSLTTLSYIASYREDLPDVFKVLDALASDVSDVGLGLETLDLSQG
ncbi:KAP P-loop protein [Undibacterium sp. CY7W]|uniref:KAP P-loop protein n=1 Tax=Undibacterium rugosum TaxID=2762291 RepID=A0A923I2B9_9BURK|nr:P-loop NTPase fold protein [Undibacterium rugosum]MBC3935762.1 KAP P-loop protein [Undibacterium rugosum]